MPRIDELTPIGELSNDAVFPIVQNDITYKASISQIPSGGGGNASPNKLISMDLNELNGAVDFGVISSGESVVLYGNINAPMLDVDIDLPYKIELYAINATLGGNTKDFTIADLRNIALQFPGFQGITFNGVDTISEEGIITIGAMFTFDTVENADTFYLQMADAVINAATIFSPSAEEVTAHLRGE